MFTSVYPDIDGAKFIESLAKALAMAEDLPKTIYRYVTSVNEIRYNPPSKHFIKFGPPDFAIAYYDRNLSRRGRRVIFVRRAMKWSSTADLLLSIIHEGVHVQQDIKAELRQATDTNDEYSALWYLDDPADPQYKLRIRFECEALMAELTAAKALELNPKTIERSQYLALCPDVQNMLINWKNQRFNSSMKNYNIINIHFC